MGAAAGLFLLLAAILAGGGAVGLASVLLALAGAAPLLAAFWVSAWGAGRALGGRGPAGAAALGAAAVLLAGWLAAWAVGLNAAVAVAVVLPGWILAGAAAWRTHKRPGRGDRRRVGFGPLLLTPGLALLAVAASIPPGGVWAVEAFGYDATSYHLQIPREWLASGGGRMAELEHNVYAYLPGLVENAFALAMAALGVDPAAGPLDPDRVASAAVPCQLLHASFAVVAALCVREAVGRRGVPGLSEAPGWAAAGVFLAVPWVVITGSSAYNEMAALAFGAAALTLVSADRGTRTASDAAVRGAQVGLLLGAACLAKPTAGFLLALPLGGWMLGRVWLDPRNRSGVKTGFAGPRTVAASIAKRRRSAALLAVGVAAAVGFATLCPWFLRNAAWTGNPVFPFATGLFGSGHWGPEQIARWAAAHAAPADASPGELWRQWLGNRGFGAVGGGVAEATATDVARFAREGGVPVLWLLAAAGVALGLGARRTRGPAAGVVWLLGFQLAAWWLLTHHQSRFLAFTALPGALGVGLLVDALGRRRPGAGWAVAAPAVAVLAAVAASVLGQQTRRLPDPATGAAVALAPWELVGALSVPGFDGLDAHPVDALPGGSRVLVVGTNGGLVYADRPLSSASAFDENPLGPWTEAAAAGPDPGAALAAILRANGFTHVLIGWSELARLDATYGVDPRLEPARLAALTRGWPGERTAAAALLRVPPAPAAAPRAPGGGG